MAGFRRAVELGAQFIETDLHLTQDAQVVAIHDSTVNRTTNGNGEIHSLTFAEVRALDAGAWFPCPAGESSEGERSPASAKFSNSRRNATSFFTWRSSPAPPAASNKLSSPHCALPVKPDASIVISFDPATLEAVHRLDRNVMTGYLCDRAGDDLVERSVQIGVRQIVPHARLVTCPPWWNKRSRAGSARCRLLDG